jgi:Arc/MetJ family transcription regulator
MVGAVVTPLEDSLRAEALELLGLDASASKADVESAFRDLVQIWHPDRFAHNPRLQSKAEQQLKRFNWARDILLGRSSARPFSRASSSRAAAPASPPPEARAPFRRQKWEEWRSNDHEPVVEKGGFDRVVVIGFVLTIVAFVVFALVRVFGCDRN